MKTTKQIIGLGSGERRYQVNGVTYIVSARFQPCHENSATLPKRVERIITGDFVPLLNKALQNTITDEYVYSGCAASEDA